MNMYLWLAGVMMGVVPWGHILSPLGIMGLLCGTGVQLVGVCVLGFIIGRLFWPSKSKY